MTRPAEKPKPHKPTRAELRARRDALLAPKALENGDGDLLEAQPDPRKQGPAAQNGTGAAALHLKP